MIPTFAIHNDEKFFPDPEKFDPMRFYSENRPNKSIIDMPYLPFADGPRNCIGMRLAKMCIKVGIFSTLQQYTIELDDRHIGKKLKFSMSLCPIGGIYLKFKAKQVQ